VRRILSGTAVFLAMSGTFLVLPVYAKPVPTPTPVEASIDAVVLGTVAEPEGEAVVTTDGEVVDAGDEAPVAPEPQAAPSAAPTAGAEETEETGETGVASSGDEVPGVPALTVSRPDTDRFETVGVTWAHDDAVSGVVVQVRVKDEDGKWGDWSELDVDEMTPTAGDPTGPAPRGGTAPYWVGASFGIEVVVQAADGATPQDVQVQLIDPGSSPADAVPGPPTATATAGAVMHMPEIYSRAQWGADESIRAWDPDYAATITSAAIHHTADGNDYTKADVAGIMRSTYAYHTVSRGWGDIGYNVIVDKFGRAWEGRYGGLSSTVVGAHTGGFNTSTFGVSMLGNYDLVEPPQAMLETVAHVIAWKFSLYKVNPRGTATLTSGGGGTAKYAAGTEVTVPAIFAHRDVGNTACPGKYGYAHMNEIRTLVVAFMGDLSRSELPGAYTQNADGSMTTTFRGDPYDVPLTCDWDGDGKASLGVWRKGRFVLYQSNQGTTVLKDFVWALPTDTPLCGDWNGDGVETIGVWRAGYFYLKNTNSPTGSYDTIQFGKATDRPLVADWDGDGRDSPGVKRGYTFYWGNDPRAYSFDGSLQFGNASDLGVVGDWDGDGVDTVGVWRDGVFYLSGRTSGRWYDTIWWGREFDVPVSGDWGNDHKDGIGVARGY
jgi:hypothetical protein